MAALPDKLSYARSLLITAPLIFFYTAVMATLSLLSSLLDANGTLQHGCSRVWSRLILWTSRVRVKVYGAANIKPGVPYVLCANHQSHMDIPITLVALPIQFRFAAKKELFRVPFLGWHLRRSGHVAIDRENPRAAIRSLTQAADAIRRSKSVVIFPEGGTSLSGAIKPFKGGGFMLATKSGAEVVPVTIRGTREVLQPKTYHVRSGVVEVTIGRPISSHNRSTSELAEMVRDEIMRTFNGGGVRAQSAVETQQTLTRSDA
jgi:1-acyl-sn-glycerol-3-phosphate acyltransferase